MWHLKVSVSEAELTAFPLQLCPLVCPLWGHSSQQLLVTTASVTVYSQLPCAQMQHSAAHGTPEKGL